MTDSFDEQAGHKHFAASCFNGTWDLLDQGSRTDEETEVMIDRAHASRLHWRHRDDESPKTQSVSAWQISRVYAVAGRPDEALRYGTNALDIARIGGAGEFYVAYGHEAVARAAASLGDSEAASLHLSAARELLQAISDDERRTAVESDLDSISVERSLPDDERELG